MTTSRSLAEPSCRCCFEDDGRLTGRREGCGTPQPRLVGSRRVGLPGARCTDFWFGGCIRCIR